MPNRTDHEPSSDRTAVRRLSAGERRAQLIAVALRLFSERGFRATTMDDVADAAGVTKPLVYQHFSSKRALYLELVDSVAKELVAQIATAVRGADGPRQQVERGFAAFFHMVVTHEDAFLLLYGRNEADPDLDEAQRRVENAIAEAISPLINAGLDDDHRRFLAYAVVGMAEGASRHWVATRGEQRSTPNAEVARLGQRLADLAWAGLRSVHAD